MSKEELCDWCQEAVFDKYYLALVPPKESDDEPLDRQGGPFTPAIDGFAWYANRNASAGFDRSFRRKIDLLLIDASNSCIFCQLLKNAFESMKARPVDYLEFSVRANHPWQWSEVTITSDASERPNRAWYYRFYKKVALKALRQDSNVFYSTGDHLESKDSVEGRLSQDGRALRAMIENTEDNNSYIEAQGASNLPSMLLRVSGHLTSPTVRLVRVSEIRTSPIKYARLSYCWGGPQPNMTTTSLVNSYLCGIPTSVIPATVLDSIKVTMSMGYEYLWVDAFCTVQDSDQGKVAELAKMSSIYARAACTICTMTAKEATDGFLCDTYPDPLNLQSIHTWHADVRDARTEEVAGILEVRSDFSKQDIHDSPVLERAWTLQEAMVSPRLVLFLSQGQRPALRGVEQTLRTDGGRILGIPKSLVSLDELVQGTRKPVLSISSGWKKKEKELEDWAAIVGVFSHRRLTYEEDKMPALMSIATEWHNRVRPGIYWAGLWSYNIAYDLMWKVPNTKPRFSCKSYVAPSWSWASRAHPVGYQAMRNINPYVCGFKVISCDIIPVNENIPMGAIRSAKLTIECIAEEVDLVYGIENYDHIACKVFSGPARVWLDDNPRPPGLDKGWLLWMNNEEPYNNPHGIGLVVAETGQTEVNSSKLYKRVGRFLCEGGQGDQLKGPLRTFVLI